MAKLGRNSAHCWSPWERIFLTPLFAAVFLKRGNQENKQINQSIDRPWINQSIDQSINWSISRFLVDNPSIKRSAKRRKYAIVVPLCTKLLKKLLHRGCSVLAVRLPGFPPSRYILAVPNDALADVFCSILNLPERSLVHRRLDILVKKRLIPTISGDLCVKNVNQSKKQQIT